MPSGDKELGYGWEWGVFPLHVLCHGRAPVILPRLFTDGETGLREWALDCSCLRERTWGPDPALGLLHRVGGEIHVVLCHWARPMSQVLPAWPVSCPLYPGDQALLCPPFPEGGNAQRGEGTSPWPNRWEVAQVGFERGVQSCIQSTVCPEGLWVSGRGQNKPTRWRTALGSLCPAKS